MKKNLKKISALALGLALVVGIYLQLPKSRVNAQACAVGQTSGNLYGVIKTENMGFIYLSTETWNDFASTEGHATTNEQISVSFDRRTGQWSGRGWNPYAGWVDFGQMNPTHSTQKIAEFESMTSNAAGWGYLTPTFDLSNVVYETDPGGFVGSAVHGDFTYYNDVAIDNTVGAGNMDFSEVSIIQSPCVQYVNLTLNGQRRNLYNETCPFSPNARINWVTENVQPGSCEIASNNWNQSIGTQLPDSYENGTTYSYTGTATDANPSDSVMIQCTGSNGQTLFSSLAVTCGSTVEPPIDGIVIPTYKEV